MKEWLDYWENDIKRGLKISDMLVERIDMKMLDSIFGKKMYYSITEAKKVFKKLKTKSEYEELDYKGNGIKRRDMLDLFKQHNKNYLYRGSAVNNPKIPESYYKNWHTIEKNHHIEIRKFLKG
jgi:hypothetical protein